MRFGLIVASLASLSFLVPACVGDAPSDTSADAGGGGDGNVASCASPGAPTCAHGKCDDSTGSAKCVCDPGFTGATCADACPDGGTCSSSTCATTTCQPHALCDDSTGAPICKCAPGYVGTSSCTWGSAPLDPGFQNTPANAWTLIDGPVLQSSAAGSVEPGDVHFDHATVCTSEGRVTQTVQMPPYAVAEPLALNVTASMTCSSSDQGCAEENGDETHAIAVSFNGGYEALPTTDAYSGSILCLGERAYGGPIKIALEADGDGCSDATLAYDALIDHADIEPTAACPAPGFVTNFDFEAANGWATTANGGTAEIKNGVGVAGSRGGHAVSLTWSQTPSLSEVLSIPGDASKPNEALTLSFNGNNDAMQVTIDGHDIGELVATGGQESAHLCVPDWAKGLVHPVNFTFDYRNDSINGSNFSSDRDFAIDNVAWATDTTCAASALIADSGFERTDPARAWVLRAAQGLAGGANVAAIITDAGAHGGTHSAKLGVTSNCATAYAGTSFTVPAPTATAGPALQFYFKSPAASGSISYKLGAAFGALSGSSSTWNSKLVCIDPKLAGRPMNISFTNSGPGGSCTGTFAEADGYVDDVVPTTDASCPH